MMHSNIPKRYNTLIALSCSMGYRDDTSLGETEKILLAMHNLSLVRPEKAWTLIEIAMNTSITEEDTLKILAELEKTGYVKSLSDQTGTKKFYLSSSGIIKISAFFT